MVCQYSLSSTFAEGIRSTSNGRNRSYKPQHGCCKPEKSRTTRECQIRFCVSFRRSGLTNLSSGQTRFQKGHGFTGADAILPKRHGLTSCDVSNLCVPSGIRLDLRFNNQARFQKGNTRVLRSDAITTNWVIYFSLTSPVIRFLETVFGLQVVRQSQSAAALPVSERSFLFTRKNLRSCLISGSRTG